VRSKKSRRRKRILFKYFNFLKRHKPIEIEERRREHKLADIILPEYGEIFRDTPKRIFKKYKKTKSRFLNTIEEGEIPKQIWNYYLKEWKK